VAAFDGAERRVVDLDELAELREVPAHEREVVTVVEVADLPDPVQARLVAQLATEREARVRRVRDQPVVPQDPDHLGDRPALRIVRVHVEVLRHARRA
jgi:hypothetical protein